MKGYAAREVFSAREKQLLNDAQALVDIVPYELGGEPVRCHELARAVGAILKLDVMDGHFGFVEHSWLWTDPFPAQPCGPSWGLPNVLDVYVPGVLPQVQLVDTSASLPHRYSPRPIKDLVIRGDIVDLLVDIMEKTTAQRRMVLETAFHGLSL